MTHSPEPWARHYDSGDVVIRDAQGDVVICELEDAPRGSEDAERIVACVNFCRGIPLDWLKKRHLTLEPGFVALKVNDYQDRLVDYLPLP